MQTVGRQHFLFAFPLGDKRADISFFRSPSFLFFDSSFASSGFRLMSYRWNLARGFEIGIVKSAELQKCRKRREIFLPLDSPTALLSDLVTLGFRIRRLRVQACM